MENKTVAKEIYDDFVSFLVDVFPIYLDSRIEILAGLEKILEKRLGSTRVLCDSEKLAEEMGRDTTFGWVDDEPHNNLCACEACLLKAANEKD